VKKIIAITVTMIFYPLMALCEDFRNPYDYSTSYEMPWESPTFERYHDQRINFLSDKGYTNGGRSLYIYEKIDQVHDRTPENIDVGNINIEQNSRVKKVVIRVKARGGLNARNKVDVGNVTSFNNSLKQIDIKVDTSSISAGKWERDNE